MDDLDIDELLECDDIEQTAFISSSKQLLKVVDNLITGIDDRLSYKRGGNYGGYFGGAGSFIPDEYGPGQGFNYQNGLYGYHKHQS